MVWTCALNTVKIIVNEEEWKKTQEQTMYMMDGPSQEKCREEKLRLMEGR
jgi:hypothetical protein